MKPLPLPDLHHLRAALGWLELGNHFEANEELEEIRPRLRVHPDVLEIRWQIYAKPAKKHLGDGRHACQSKALSATRQSKMRLRFSGPETGGFVLPDQRSLAGPRHRHALGK